jgi:hypothetical protein
MEPALKFRLAHGLQSSAHIVMLHPAQFGTRDLVNAALSGCEMNRDA